MTKSVRYEDNPKPVVDCSGDVVLTQQSDAAECDINYIMARAKAGVDISGQIRPGGMFGDFSNMPDFRESMNMVVKAQAAFMSLDAVVRKRFNNDPAELLDFVQDPKNLDEAIKLGLVETPKEAPLDPHLEEIKGLRKDIKDISGAKKSKRSDDE